MNAFVYESGGTYRWAANTRQTLVADWMFTGTPTNANWPVGMAAAQYNQLRREQARRLWRAVLCGSLIPMKKAIMAILLPAVLFAADVTGTWQFQVETDAGSGTPTFQLKQEGEKLTGTYEGMLGKNDIRGTVKRDEVVIEFETDATGEKATIRYAGKLEGTDKISGKVTLGPMSGTFTGKKK